MTARFFRPIVAACVFIVLMTAALALDRAQAQQTESGGQSPATMQGYVRDPRGKPAANATVSLLRADGNEIGDKPIQVTQADSAGGFRFAALPPGAYFLRAEMSGYGERVVGPVTVAAKEKKILEIVLAAPKDDAPQNPSKPLPTAITDTPAPQFYDEPQFTVAGVTQATNAGGHGSDSVLRTSEALARATVSLSKEVNPQPATNPSAALPAATEDSLRDELTRDPESFEANQKLGKRLVASDKTAEALPYLQRASRLNPNDPDLHHLLADLEEKLGDALQAVREYQRAAELDPSELYLYDWGTELLTHRALEPATEVFTKGNRLFPQSVRMLVALGVAWYARGSDEQAAQYLANASDLDPANPTPYLFLGRMQSAEITPPKGTLEKLARFAQLQPENPQANYYYAVGLFKQWEQSPDAAEARHDRQPDVQLENDDTQSQLVESLLQKAVHLDPKFGAAYLELGILYARRGDFRQAISAYEKAIAVSADQVSPLSVHSQSDETLEEAHYRLAQAYLRTGDKPKAQEQLKLHDRLSKKTKENTERERREIQGFAIVLRGEKAGSPPQN